MPRIRPWLGLFVAALPFAFATIRWVATGNDSRYAWMAAASTLGALVALVPRRSTGVTLLRASAGLLTASVSAAIAALLLGATAGPGVAVVSLCFGLCSGVGLVLYARPGEVQNDAG